MEIFKRKIAVDLGTKNTIMVYNDEIIINEPSIIAINMSNRRLIAVGHVALKMHGKNNCEINTILPLKEGVISDFYATSKMIREMINIVRRKKKLIFPSLKLLISVPIGITEVEKRAIKETAKHAGCKSIHLINGPMAAAIGIGVEVVQPKGNMIVDIGGGISEIAVISSGEIICFKSIRIAGNEFTNNIQKYMQQKHNLRIGENTAEKIKIAVGAATINMKNLPNNFQIKGIDLQTGIPKEVYISCIEIVKALDKAISDIEKAILKVLEITPPELAADIYHAGIYLTGGGSLLRGLGKRFSEKTNLIVHNVAEPLLTVAIGSNIVLNNLNKFQSKQKMNIFI